MIFYLARGVRLDHLQERKALGQSVLTRRHRRSKTDPVHPGVNIDNSQLEPES